MAIVAGTHVVTASETATKVYRQLEFPAQYVGQNRFINPAVRQAVCVVIEPDNKPVVFGKQALSKWESQLVQGQHPLEDCLISTKSGKLQINVLICIEALGDSRIAPGTRGIPSLTVIPAFSPKVEPFYAKARLLWINEVCTLFANIADFGGSKAFLHTGQDGRWFTDGEGTTPLGPLDEGLVVADIDLGIQYDVRDSAKTHSPLHDVQVYPIVYPSSAEAVKTYLAVAGKWVDSPSRSDPALIARELKQILRTQLPQLLRSKLEHFAYHVGPAGVSRPQEMPSWVECLTVNETESTDSLRWVWSGRALKRINELIVSSTHTDRQNDLNEVYSSLNRRRSSLLKRLPTNPAPSSLRSTAEDKSNGERASSDTPFLDRSRALGRIRSFAESTEPPVMVVNGMRGIGKTALLREAFRQIIPPLRPRLWMYLTEGVSYERFLTELAHRCGVGIAPDAELSDQSILSELASDIEAYVSAKQRALIVLDEFQHVLNPAGDFRDERIAKLLATLTSRAEEGGVKFFWLSDVRPKASPEIESKCQFLPLRGLEESETRQLVRYWFEYERGELPAYIEDPPQRFIGWWYALHSRSPNI